MRQFYLCHKSLMTAFAIRNTRKFVHQRIDIHLKNFEVVGLNLGRAKKCHIGFRNFCNRKIYFFLALCRRVEG